MTTTHTHRGLSRQQRASLYGRNSEVNEQLSGDSTHSHAKPLSYEAALA